MRTTDQDQEQKTSKLDYLVCVASVCRAADVSSLKGRGGGQRECRKGRHVSSLKGRGGSRRGGVVYVVVCCLAAPLPSLQVGPLDDPDAQTTLMPHIPGPCGASATLMVGMQPPFTVWCCHTIRMPFVQPCLCKGAQLSGGLCWLTCCL